MQIACSHCGARYAFEAALIPVQGYDARCTSCQKVFFVHPEGQAAPSGDRASEAETSEGAVPHFAPQSLHRGTMEMAPQSGRTPAASAPVAPLRAQAGPTEEAQMPAAPSTWEAREFVGIRPGRRHEERHTEPPMRRPWARRGLFLGVALVAVIGSGVVVGVVLSKRLHVPPQVQPPIHIVRPPDPIAAEAFARGIRALWEDTDASYLAASKAFDAALARDGSFTDAWAGAALASLWQAADFEARAKDMLGQTAQQLTQAMNDVARAARAGAPVSRPDASSADDAADGSSTAQLLRVQQAQTQALAANQDRAASAYLQASALQRHAAALLLHGEHLTTQTPLLAAAQAIWYVGDPQSLGRVSPLLKAIEQLAGHGDGSAVVPPAGNENGDAIAAGGNPEAGAPPPKEPAPPSPYTPLRLWVQARLYSQDGRHKEAEVLAAYDAALTLQPELRRARYELAVYQLAHGHPDAARPLLEDLAHSQPPHARAQALLAVMAQGPAQMGSP